MLTPALLNREGEIGVDQIEIDPSAPRLFENRLVAIHEPKQAVLWAAAKPNFIR